MRHRRGLPSPRGTKKMKNIRMRAVLILFFLLTCTYVAYSTYTEKSGIKTRSLVGNPNDEPHDKTSLDQGDAYARDIDNQNANLGAGPEGGVPGTDTKNDLPDGQGGGDGMKGMGDTIGEPKGPGGDNQEGSDRPQPPDQKDAGAGDQGEGHSSPQGSEPAAPVAGTPENGGPAAPGAGDGATGGAEGAGEQTGGAPPQGEPTQSDRGVERKEGASTAVQGPVMTEAERIALLEKKLSEIEQRTHGFMEVPYLNIEQRKRILITGGAGFVGSHLVDKLMLQGHEVTVADNFFTGRKRNVEHWLGHENFELINHDVVNPLFLEVDEIYHLASPASPPHYMQNPVKTIKCNTVGTINVLGLAKRVNARVLFASTSEVYGDPEQHPQQEEYWGHVNPIGPRACYDESKRVGETLCISYAKQDKVEVRIARIFNTYGPRMHINDGRVVSNFILQALKEENITIYGPGNQTRSFQFVDDLVNGLVALMGSNVTSPVNIGNPEEQTITSFAQMILKTVGGPSKIVKLPPVTDDPRRRKPDITKAKTHLNWEPQVSLADGIRETVKYFRGELERSKHSERNVYLPKSLGEKSLAEL